MDDLTKVGVALWALVIVTGGVTAAELTSSNTSEDTDATVSNQTVYVNESGVNAQLSNESASVQANTSQGSVELSNIGDENKTQKGSIHSDSIDEGVERDSKAGLCAVGLSSDESPIGVDTDGDNGVFSVIFKDTEPGKDYENPHDGKSAQEIVDECQTNDYGYRDGEA